MRRPRFSADGCPVRPWSPLATHLDHVYRTLGRPVILLAFAPTPDGGFATEFAHSALSRAHVGAAALDLLRFLRDDLQADPCRDCLSCTARLSRIEAAIGALETPDAEGATQ